MVSLESTTSRALFVSASAYPLGGLATWLDYLLPALREKGWDTVLGLVEGARYHRPRNYLELHPQEDWIPISCRTGTPEGRTRAVARAIGEYAPDLVIGVNIPDTYRAVARMRRKGSSVRTVMTIHGILPQLFDDARRFAGVLDGVAGTNRLACALTARLGGIADDRIWYAPYGMELPETLPPAIRQAGALRIGFVGRFDQDQKRVLDLPAISAALDHLEIPHRWRLAGTGPEESVLHESLDSERTTFLGHVPQAELTEAVYRQVDVLLIPSRWETGPLVAWEAMREGVPVVASRYVGSGLEAALRHEENALLFPVGDTARAARELGRLFRDSELARNLRDGGVRLLRQRYNREASVVSWERCFRDVLDRPPRPVEVEPDVPTAHGRLGRWLPADAAETVRRVLRRAAPDSGPGGEWPHSYGARTPLDEFLPLAREVDGGGSVGVSSHLAHADRP